MSLSLPADPPSARSLTGVLPQLLGSLSGAPDWFPEARSAIVVMVDGLGRGNLSARAGHARFLSERMTKRDAARTVFPTTTAAALTSLLTGESPGIHGIVGYSARVPESGRAVNQLQGWETDGLDPETWQRSEPLLAREAIRGRPCFVVSKPSYAGTGFTRAIQRGARFVGAEAPADRLGEAARLAAGHPGALIYVYLSELDATGHKYGWESDRWLSKLETLDGDIRAFDAALDATSGAVLTADHGMVDVPTHRQVLLRAEDSLLDGVTLMAGEPRMLHLYSDDDAAGVLSRWREAEGERSWVLSRDEAIAAGLFGPEVAPEVAPRIGDVLVAARAGIAYYDDRMADKKSQRMIGQHGSLTDAERIVPLIRLGAFGR